jgi:hypothetical protein
MYGILRLLGLTLKSAPKAIPINPELYEGCFWFTIRQDRSTRQISSMRTFRWIDNYGRNS